MKSIETRDELEPGTGEYPARIAAARESRRRPPVYGAPGSVNRVMREGAGATVHAMNSDAR